MYTRKGNRWVLLLTIALAGAMMAACGGANLNSLNRQLAYTLVTCPPPNCPPDTLYLVRVKEKGQSKEYAVEVKTIKTLDKSLITHTLKITPAQQPQGMTHKNLDRQIAHTLITCPPPNCPPDTLRQERISVNENIYAVEIRTNLRPDRSLITQAMRITSAR